MADVEHYNPQKPHEGSCQLIYYLFEMAWSEVSPGRFQRRIGENEAFIKFVGDSGHALGREHWAINAIAAIDTTGD